VKLKSIEVEQDIRAQTDRLISEGCFEQAHSLLYDMWAGNPNSATAAFVTSRWEKIIPLQAMSTGRITIIRSFTLEPTIPLLRAAAAVNRIDLKVEIGGFNTYVQELLNSSSQLYQSEPDIVFLAVQTRDVAPDLWQGFSNISAEHSKLIVDRVSSNYLNWVESFRRNSKASLVIHGLELPAWPNSGLIDQQSNDGQAAAICKINNNIRNIVSKHPSVYMLEYDALIARYGRENWHDERKWLTMRMPISAGCIIHLVNEWLRFIHPLMGKVCKVLVTDLDNTLWGGIVGEDGAKGIKLDNEYPGAGYQDLQRAMLDLNHRGVLLAISSKNNLDDAMEVLERHPHMLLRPENFAAIRVNWNDKAQSLREIALELNIGTDALAFLDDNPFERKRIRSEMPEVTVIELQPDPLTYEADLRCCPVFERLALSAEDKERSRYYAEERQRSALQQSTNSLEEFYNSLGQQVEIASATGETVARVSQLTQKTNQFNLTTRRYNELQISVFIDNPQWNVLTVRAQDRFGDSGLIGVAITHDSGNVCEIDSFLLSCRVIGRGVETAILAYVISEARSRGMEMLMGWFIPTPKNAPARDFYQTHGFYQEREQNNEILWTLKISQSTIDCPNWIELKINKECK
jgi:FkbH-like protein